MKVIRPSYRWDEDDTHLWLCFSVGEPGVGAASSLRLHWTPEGGFEFDYGVYHLKAQLMYRVEESSVHLMEETGELTVRLRKHRRREWGRVWLNELDDDDVEVHLRRERGLALRPRTSNSSNSVREPLIFKLKRLRVGRVFSIPLGYTKQVLHDMWGLDLVVWFLAVLLACMCPHYSIQERSSSSFAVTLLVRSLSWPLVRVLGVSSVLAARIVVATLVVTALKLFRLEIGRDQPVSWARSFGLACCLQYAFLATFSWTVSEVFALVGALLMFKFWHAERFTRLAFIGVFSSMLLHVDVAILLFAIVVDCVIRRRLRLGWLIWCVVVFSAMTWLFFVLPFDSWRHDEWVLVPGAWRDARFSLAWITSEDLIPFGGLALVGFIVQPNVRRYIYVAAVREQVVSVFLHILTVCGKAFQLVMWVKGDTALLSLFVVPLFNIACAGALQALWMKRRRWYTLVLVFALLSVSIVVSFRHFMGDKCSV